MNLLNPIGLAFLGLIPVVIFFYLLKLKRQRMVVSSTLFWRRSVQDLRANRPLQRLRSNLLLFIQLLIICLIALGLSRPVIKLISGQGRAIILLIDVSQSMKASEPDGKQRIDKAKEQVREVINSLGRRDRMMIISFAQKAQVLTPFTSDKDKLKGIIARLEPVEAPTYINEAFELASSIASGEKNPELVILSDGTFQDEIAAEAPKNVKTAYIPIGSQVSNVGIVAMDLSRSGEAPDFYEVFARLANFSAQEVTAQLELLNNESLVDLKEVRLAAGEQKSVLFTGKKLSPGTVVLELKHKDALAADNRAFAIVREPEISKVLLVSAGNFFLEKVLQTMKEIEASKVAPGEEKELTNYELIIFDNYAPEKLEAGNFIFINSLPPLDGFEYKGDLESPLVYDWRLDHPVMRFIELEDIIINKAMAVKLPEAALVLAESEPAPLIALYEDAMRKMIIFHFDIFDTNLPLQPSFPILISNSLNYLSESRKARRRYYFNTGEVLTLKPPENAGRVTLIDPKQRGWLLARTAAGEVLFEKTFYSGVYQVECDGKPWQQIVFNMFDPEEANLKITSELQFKSGQTIKATERLGLINREIWRWLVLAVLVLIMLEWLVYHRRVLV